MEELQFIEELGMLAPAEERIPYVRRNLLEEMNDADFFAFTRFTKDGVRRLAGLLDARLGRANFRVRGPKPHIHKPSSHKPHGQMPHGHKPHRHMPYGHEPHSTLNYFFKGKIILKNRT